MVVTAFKATSVHTQKKIDNENGLKIVHVNAMSVLNKLDDICTNMSFFDVVIITATWLDCSTHDSIVAWPGYNQVRMDRSQFRDKRGGGLCIYIKANNKFEVIPLQILNVKKNIEVIQIKTKPPNQKPIKLISIYCPPDGSIKEFTRTLSKLIEPIDQDRSDLVIIGDFNIDYSNKIMLQTSGLMRLELKDSLTQIVKHYTRISKESKTTIVLIYTDMKNISKAVVINYDLSDHLPIFFIKKKQRNEIE